MEEVLRQLQEAMHAHRRALAQTRAPWTADDATDDATAATPARDARGAVIQRLTRDIERISGIEISGMMEAKLGRVLA